MNYNRFLEMLVQKVQERLGEQALIQIIQVQKINQPVVDGMTILMPGENASPAFYLDAIYQAYLDGEDLDELTDEILTFYRENKKTGVCDLSFYKDFCQARDGITCRLVNYEKNQSLLEQVPHHHFLDFAIVYYYVMDSPVFGKSSILVRDNHITHWGITSDELHEIALQNTRAMHPFQILTINEALETLFGHPVQYPEDPPSMYILTNKEMYCGAIYIIFEDILSDFSDFIGGDFYILPSSIHECLLLPISPYIESDPQTLREMVSEVNQKPEIISPEDVLGNSVYRYDHQARKLRPAESRQVSDPSVSLASSAREI